MTHSYPGRRAQRDESLCEYDDYGRMESCHRPDRLKPAGLDETETYTDLYNVPHEAPKRHGK